MTTSMVSVRRAYGDGQAIRSAPARRAAAEGRVATAGGEIASPCRVGRQEAHRAAMRRSISFAVRRAKSATGGGEADEGETRSANRKRPRGSPSRGNRTDFAGGKV